jgi:hypothetical protein
MTVLRYVEALLLSAVALVPIGAGAWALRHRLLPSWSGAPARLVEIVAALGTVTATTELLGLVDLYRVAPVVIGLAAIGALEWWWGRRAVRDPATGDPVDGNRAGLAPVPPPPQLGRVGRLATVATIAVVAADWGTRTADALHQGMITIDTLWYHMPTAVRFVQTGSLRHVQYVDGGAVTAFYPANSPLLHGIGVMLMGNDLLSPLMNLGWLAFALLAGWCIGRPYRAGPVSLAGVAVVLATPGLVATQAGSAYTDVVGLALVLAAVAIVVEANQRATPVVGYGVAALAAGLALGTKYTLLLPVLALTVGVVVIAKKGERWSRTVAWAAGLIVGGSFWYLRNWFTVGNPLPSLGFKVGPIDFKNLTPADSGISSVAHYLGDGSVWRRYFLPGLGQSLGPVWWALLALVFVGIIAGLIVGPTRTHRLVAFVALASFVGFLWTPQFLLILGAPYYFAINLRYASPALALGLVALPMVAATRPVLRWWVLGAYGFVLAGTQLSGTLWPFHFATRWLAVAIGGQDWPAGLAVGLVAVVGGLLVMEIRRRPADARPSRRAVVAGVVALLAIAGAFLQVSYQTNRYASPRLDTLSAFTWARDLRDQRIAVYGPYGILQYPLYGKDLSNHVQYIGVQHADGNYTAITDCVTWRRILNAGRYDYILLSKAAAADPPEWTWTSSDPATTRVPTPRSPLTAVYRINGRLDPSTCPAPAAS